MLTEVGQTLYQIKVAGRVVATNIPSRQLAEATLFNLPPADRSQATIETITTEGKSLLLG
jgi:hypothetical protein